MTLGFSKSTKIAFAGMCVVYLVVVWFAIEALAALYINNVLSTQRENLQQRLSLLTSSLEASVYKDIFLAESVSSIVAFDPEFAQSNWSAIAESLVSRAAFVRNLALAPDDVITHIYPIKGNEATLGLDYRTVPEQFKTMRLARSTGSVHLAGPVDLVQGGVGLIARFPIFKDYPKNKEYWGTMGVAIDYTKLLTSLDMLVVDGANIALRRITSPTAFNEANVFFGQPALFSQSDVTLPVNLPGAKWELAAKFTIDSLPTIQKLRLVIRGLGWIFALALLTSVILFLRYLNFTRIASLQDELTLLPNRRFAMHQLSQLMQQSRQQRTFAVLNIDVNGFKSINDRFGHHAGDEYLQHIAAVLRGVMRSSDTVSRMGGDEFLIILHRADNSANINTTIEKIQHAMLSNDFECNKERVSPSLSIGFAMASEFVSVSALMKAADSHMYENKQALTQANKQFFLSDSLIKRSAAEP